MTLQELGNYLGQPVRVSDQNHPWFNQSGLLIALRSHLKTTNGLVIHETACVVMGDGRERTFSPHHLIPA